MCYIHTIKHIHFVLDTFYVYVLPCEVDNADIGDIDESLLAMYTIYKILILWIHSYMCYLVK